MKTAFITHPDCDGHVTPPGHPEQVARLDVIRKALAGFDLLREDAPLGRAEDILRCHPQHYIDRIEASVPENGWNTLDGDTHMAPGSYQAGLRGVGGVTRAVDMVVNGDVGNAFVAARPPGHHAETETAMGFCLFGNAAIAAKYALDHHGLSKVAVLDFDVHHGNGTQDLLWHEPRAIFVSSHQMPLYPGSGARGERGAHGQMLNIPLESGTGSVEMRAAWEHRVMPMLRREAPELIIISAGFDAHGNDPLAGLNWTTEDFAWLTREICTVAAEVCSGRVVSTLEGGYDLEALGAATAAHVQELMEHAT
ncbi:histone deacetylase family protein [Halocynthiibacter namhaensis]|uniref:histone deacetylase family protein n=1 Tax=Halocynthiibacter namhaensis TaxID=1290553 RepID=UPI0005792E48|nr:histone deacetylase family protein [Halocynthiibacter namhaensis]